MRPDWNEFGLHTRDRPDNELRPVRTCLGCCRGPFLKSPETLRAVFGCHNSLFISRTERILVVKLHSYFFL